MTCARRNFIRGSLAAGALALGGTALTACAPSSAEEATESAAQTTGRWSWSTAPEPIADSDIAETVDCDVCIPGAGVAGNPASLYGTTSACGKRMTAATNEQGASARPVAALPVRQAGTVRQR